MICLPREAAAERGRLAICGDEGRPPEGAMDFDYSPRQRELMGRVQEFMDRHIYPAEKIYAAQMEEATRKGNRWIVVPIVEELKAKAKAQGLWNFFLPQS